MKRALSLLNMCVILLISPFNAALAQMDSCPYSSTNMCVLWFEKGVSYGTWNDENDRFWRYYGDLKPYKEPLSLKLKLLTDANSLHVINGKGEQNLFPTRLMYAYKESRCSMEIAGRCYGSVEHITEMGFDVVAHGVQYQVNLVSTTSGSDYFRRTEYCTYIDSEFTCRTIRHRR